MRHARDEADSPGMTWDCPRLARIVLCTLQSRDIRVLCPYDIQHLSVRQHLVLTPLVPAERHVLDETDFDILIARQVHKRQDLVVIQAAHDNAVDLQLDACADLVQFLHTVDALHDGIEALAAGEKLELEGIERVEADVDAGETRFHHGIELAPQADAVGGESQLFQPGAPQATDPLHEREDVLADCGLATRQADLAHTLMHKELAEVEDLGGRELRLGRREVDALLRHAVQTSQVAALGDGDAQVVVLAGKGIREEVGEGRGGADGISAETPRR